MLTVGSLFSGIGGLDLGLERAGMRVIWQCEIDPYARRVLAKHWPGIPCYEDVKRIDANTERPDLICGGFPCQDISSAGKGAGLSGARSGLWFEYLRIVRLLRPAFVLVENVSALSFRGIDILMGGLAESGFDAEWQALPAGAFGAVHCRDRLFVLARNPDCHHVGSIREREGQRQKAATDGGVQRENPIRLPWQDSTGPGWRGYWADEPGLGRVANGVSNRMDRLRVLGNAVVPQVAEFIGRRIIESLTPA